MIQKTKNTFFVSTTSTRKKKIFGPRSTYAPGAFRRLSSSHACVFTTWEDGGRLGAARRETGEGADGAGAVLQSYPDPPAQTSDMSARTRCRNGAACTSRGVFRICICGPRSLTTAIPRPLSQTAFRQKKSQKDKNDETN